MSTNPARRDLRSFIRALTRAEQAVAAGCVVVIVSTFLTWKSFAGVFSVDGLHSWGRLTLIVAIITAVYLTARSPFFRTTVALPKLPVTDSVAYIIAAAVEFVSVLLFSGHYAGGSIEFGFVLALIGAGLTAWGGYLGLRSRAVTLPADDAPETVEAQKDPAGSPIGRGGPPTMPPVGRAGPPATPAQEELARRERRER